LDIGFAVGPWGVTFDEVRYSMLAAEKHGFASYYLGDHFFVGEQLDSLEPYLLFALAARETNHIRFGPLVTPVMFRPPSNVGRLAAQIDLLSGGRFVLGLGVGWGDAEHHTYGLSYPSLGERFDRLDEFIAVIQAMWAKGPATFDGHYYQLDGAQTLPKPAIGRPPILIGGTGEKRTLKLVAKYANEWNSVDLTPDIYRHKCEVLAAHCADMGREPSEIRRSMTTIGFVGATDEDVEAATLTQMHRTPPPGNPTPAEYRTAMRARGAIMGTAPEIVDQLGKLSEEGLNEVQFVYFDLTTDRMPAFLASEVLPQVAKL
tara:strand:+ start:970 stop:1920 length:951 start_codon:yes stop_codon:yes gene_type:complete